MHLLTCALLLVITARLVTSSVDDAACADSDDVISCRDEGSAKYSDLHAQATSKSQPVMTTDTAPLRYIASHRPNAVHPARILPLGDFLTPCPNKTAPCDAKIRRLNLTQVAAFGHPAILRPSSSERDHLHNNRDSDDTNELRWTYEVLPALRRWQNDSYLAHNLPNALSVQVTPNTVNYMFPSDLPLASHPELIDYLPHYSRINMTAVQFLSCALKEPSSSLPCFSPEDRADVAEPDRLSSMQREHLHLPSSEAVSSSSYTLKVASPIGEVGLQLASDMPVHRFTAKPLSDKADLSTRPYFWMSQKAAWTPAHYDEFHNVYFQVRGSKEFLLADPSVSTSTPIYPALHPAHRSLQPVRSEIFVPNKPQASADGVPNAAQWSLNSSTVYRAVLEPGDVLVIPAFWFHDVRALSFSLSANVWFESDSLALAQRALAQARAGIACANLLLGCVQLVRAFLMSLLTDLSMRPGDPAQVQLSETLHESDAPALLAKKFVQHHIIDLRYESSVKSKKDADSRQWCEDVDEFQAFVQAHAADAHSAQASLQALVQQLAQLQPQVSQSVFDLVVANVVEWIVSSALGAENVRDFLQQFVRC